MRKELARQPEAVGTPDAGRTIQGVVEELERAGFSLATER